MAPHLERLQDMAAVRPMHLGSGGSPGDAPSVSKRYRCNLKSKIILARRSLDAFLAASSCAGVPHA